MHEAMSDKKPAIIEACVYPFDPPMPPKVEMEFVRKLAESFKVTKYATDRLSVGRSTNIINIYYD